MDMSSHHQFCLKWNNHSSNLLKVFGRLFSNESFTDVTLAAEGRSFRAHKMVLSACSTYFEQLFLEHTEPNPIVIMRETSFLDLAVIVEFMYKGEINVSQDQLGSLLKTAESLRVKGLAQATSAGSNGEAAMAAASDGKSPTTTTTMTPETPPPTSMTTPLSSILVPAGQPPPALLPLFHASSGGSLVDSSSVSGRESPSNKRRRLTVTTTSASTTTATSSAVSTRSVKPEPQHPIISASSAAFLPRIENVITMGLKRGSDQLNADGPSRSRPGSGSSSDGPPGASVDSGAVGSANSSSAAALDLRLTDNSSSSAAAATSAGLAAAAGLVGLAGLHSVPLQELTARLELRTDLVSQLQQQQQQQSALAGGESEILRKIQQEKSEPHCYFRGYALYKFNDYIAHGTRQQYWEEPFTKAVMEGIQDRELDLKKGAELLGVSYSTLYGRYRECHGYLRHAWTRDYRRAAPTMSGGSGSGGGGEWWEADPQDLHHRRGGAENGNGGAGPAEELVVEVDSYVEEDDEDEDDVEAEEGGGDSLPGVQASKQESLVLSIRHGKVQPNQRKHAHHHHHHGHHHHKD